MKLEAIVKVEEGAAHFDVSPVGGGVYYARLVRYTGRPGQAPPEEIVMVRGVRNWNGSCDRTELINELGEVIDNIIIEAPIFKNESRTERRHDKTRSPEQ